MRGGACPARGSTLPRVNTVPATGQTAPRLLRRAPWSSAGHRGYRCRVQCSPRLKSALGVTSWRVKKATSRAYLFPAFLPSNAFMQRILSACPCRSVACCTSQLPVVLPAPLWVSISPQDGFAGRQARGRSRPCPWLRTALSSCVAPHPRPARGVLSHPVDLV